MVHWPVPRLIVNADDFGLTSGVNRAILELHRSGVLTSATLMARAAATDEAIAIARATPTLGVGCHVVLVDGQPVAPPRSVASLLQKHTSAFPPKLTTFLRLLFSGRIRSEDIEAEARAQIQSLQARGIQLTHIDTHKHTHMFPPVLRPLLRAARSCGIQRIRNPFEPEWAVRVTPRASLVRSAEVFALRRFGPYFRRILAEEGFTTTDGTIAVAGTGVVNADTVRALLSQLPPGTWEFVTHPGYNDAELAKVRTRLRESRETERIALQAIREFPALELVSFALP
ncbi:ChbG/HpnK family deacetylase [Acidobacteria bacterium AB60]|nr:ChbG/HpnK family deacetylase [Acidobacteria bacterium AB60]